MANKQNSTPALLLSFCLILIGISISGGNTDATYRHVDSSNQRLDTEVAGIFPAASTQPRRVRRQSGPDPSPPAPASSPAPPTASTPAPPAPSTPAPNPAQSPAPPTTPTPAPTPSPAPSTASTPATQPPPPTTKARTTATTTTAAPPTGPSTTVFEDLDHDYYKSRVVDGNLAEWISEEQMVALGAVPHKTLSNDHRVAATVSLSFTFPFYGHWVRKLTVATGGFVYASDFLHQWLTATQYIAPLMANFDTTIGNTSYIHYVDAGNYFVVWWQNVQLHDKPDAGAFDFQTVIHESGRIVFNYKMIPIDVSEVPRAQHPVKVGLSDAYYIDTVTGNTKRRTIYEYHRVNIDVNKVKSHSSIIMTPLPTCIEQAGCHGCSSVPNFDCRYCPRIKMCSDGIDRHRQLWINNSCETEYVRVRSDCPIDKAAREAQGGSGKFAGGLGVGGIVAIIIILAIIIALTTVALYGYMRPQSKVGLWMIEHRPSQIRQQMRNVQFFKRSEGASADKYEVSMTPEAGSESVA